MSLAAVIGQVRNANPLIVTYLEFSMLSSAIYSRLPSAPAIMPFTRAAFEDVGFCGASAIIRGYVDTPVEIAGVAVYHPLLVIKGLAFAILIGTDILRANGSSLTLVESTPVRLRTRMRCL